MCKGVNQVGFFGHMLGEITHSENRCGVLPTARTPSICGGTYVALPPRAPEMYSPPRGLH